MVTGHNYLIVLALAQDVVGGFLTLGLYIEWHIIVMEHSFLTSALHGKNTRLSAPYYAISLVLIWNRSDLTFHIIASIIVHEE